ncbi:distal tail protein Dit, partial [Enterococcus sp. AZ189]|uniref:distal tail protein Dit n=1 Tax=Enterococcus sp. AZ189 TaxID=2774871 RepID=UPI003F683F2C
MKSDIVITYGNYTLTDNMDLIESPDFGLLPDVENSFFEQTRNDGQKFQYKRNQKKYLSFTFMMDSTDYITDRDLLVTKLNKDKPESLTISLFKDRYWNALIDGDTSFVREMDSRLSVEVKLTFVIPDGIAHATQTKIYTTDSDILTIDNKGTYKSYPIIEALMPADNGVMAFINNYGKILQFGNPDEADDEAYTESDRVIWDTVMISGAESSRGWKTNDYQFEALWDGRYKLNANGTRKFGVDGSYHYVTPNSYGTGSTGFKGITYGRKISPDTQGYVGAKNFESRHGVWFETGTIRQTGIFLTELRDKEGNAVCSITFYKLATSNNKAGIRINVKGNVKEWSFEP